MDVFWILWIPCPCLAFGSPGVTTPCSFLVPEIIHWWGQEPTCSEHPLVPGPGCLHSLAPSPQWPAGSSAGLLTMSQVKTQTRVRAHARLMVGEALWGWGRFCLVAKSISCALGCLPTCPRVLPQKSFRKKTHCKNEYCVLGPLPVSLWISIPRGGGWAPRVPLRLPLHGRCPGGGQALGVR